MTSCKICLNNYDHSIRKPHHLSCPHTFCIECINKIKYISNRCPHCNLPIRGIHQNIELLDTIPQSSYDKLKAETLKDLSKKETEINKQLKSLNPIKNLITRYSSLLIDLTTNENKAKLINEIELIEKLLKESLISAKSVIGYNQLNEQELQEFSNKINDTTDLGQNSDVNSFGFKEINIKNKLYFIQNSNQNLLSGIMYKIQKLKEACELIITISFAFALILLMCSLVHLAYLEYDEQIKLKINESGKNGLFDGYKVQNLADYDIWLDFDYFRLKPEKTIMSKSSFACNSFDCIHAEYKNITSSSGAVYVACHRTNKVYTRVNFQLGGSLMIHSSDNESWIEVLENSNVRLPYWYRCGKKSEWHYYFWLKPKNPELINKIIN